MVTLEAKSSCVGSLSRTPIFDSMAMLCIRRAADTSRSLDSKSSLELYNNKTKQKNNSFWNSKNKELELEVEAYWHLWVLF